MWTDEDASVGRVRDAERNIGADDGLSGMLGDGDARDLAAVCAFVLDGEDWTLRPGDDYLENQYK